MYKEFDKETLDKLHQIHLEILNEFAKICNKHNLSYSLAYGTLLGAIRHSGFIPWDDDVDVFMPRKDYEEFLKIAVNELDSKYYLDCFNTNKNYLLQFAKIKKNGTIFDEEATHHLNGHKGIFIDVFPMDNVYDNIKRSYFDAILIKNITNTITIKSKISKLKEARHPIIVTFFRIFSIKTLMKIQKWLSTKNKNNNSKNVVCYYSVYPFKKEVFPREDIFPTTKVTFEGNKYDAIKNYDKFLTNLYGDYMKLPPKEKRVNHMPLKLDFGDNKWKQKKQY